MASAWKKQQGVLLVLVLSVFSMLAIWSRQPGYSIGSFSEGPDNGPTLNSANVGDVGLVKERAPKPTDNLVVHYVKFYKTLSPTLERDSLNFLECMSVYSVIQNLKPRHIYLHTNAPSFWPFDFCEVLLGFAIDWSAVKLIHAPLSFTASGKRIHRIEHEADIRKFKAVEMYGGLALDFDVYIINGTTVRRLIGENPCMICHEGSNNNANAGFFGCREPHSSFPQLVLKAYETKYDPGCWMCNSGTEPMKILRKNNGTAVLVDDVCNEPNWMERDGFNLQRGNFTWEHKPAYHSFVHNAAFTFKDAVSLQSSFGDVLRWILAGSPAEMVGKPIELRRKEDAELPKQQLFAR